MKTCLLECNVKITRPHENREQWRGEIGEIVSQYVSEHSEPRYIVLFAMEVDEGTLVNFYGTEFVVLLGDENSGVIL